MIPVVRNICKAGTTKHNLELQRTSKMFKNPSQRDASGLASNISKTAPKETQLGDSENQQNGQKIVSVTCLQAVEKYLQNCNKRTTVWRS